MWSYNFLLIHPERTGGTILTDSFGVLPYVSKDVFTHKHCKASVAKRILGSRLWNSTNMIKICLYRNEEERIISWYNHIKKSSEALSNNNFKHRVDDFWKQLVNKYEHLTFEEFIKSHRLPKIDFYCDEPEMKLLTTKEAYKLLVELTEYDPQIVIY
jgi:hypothetical protein